MSAPLLHCENLHVRFNTQDGEVFAVNGVDFEIHKGDCVGIVGESGSGKSQTAMALLGLLADNGVSTGSVRFRQKEILNAPSGTAQPDTGLQGGHDLPGPDERADAVHADRPATVRGPAGNTPA